MTSTLYELLDAREIRRYAGRQVFDRGAAYFRGNRVKVETATHKEASCRVRGTRYYYVSLWIYHDELVASCTCPHADSGWFCKHMVAASLAVRDYLIFYGHTSWEAVISNTIDEVSKTQKLAPSKSFWLFLSLQMADHGWELIPYRLWLDKVPTGIFPESQSEDIANILPELVSHNHWLLQYIESIKKTVEAKDITNVREEATGFANILLKQDKTLNSNSYYYPAYPLGEYLSLLQQIRIPVFMGNISNPIKSNLIILREPAEISLRIVPVETGIQISLNLIAGDQVVHVVENHVQILTKSKPYWIRVGEIIIQVNNPFTLDRLASWLRVPEIFVPKEDENEFLEKYFPILVSQLPISGDHIQWFDEYSEPVKRIYLTDEDVELQAHLCFGYGEFEVLYEPSCLNPSIRRVGDSWKLVRIHRKLNQEKQAYRMVSSVHHGLKRSGSNNPPNVLTLRAQVDPIDFLIKYVPRLIEKGFVIYGEEKLKTARVNRQKPTLSINVTSGIDWFDIQAVVRFGDIETSLKDVQAALRRKKRYIKLADGTIGEIPEEWIQRYKHLFGLGERTEKGFRLSNHHLSLIDQLLVESERNLADEQYHQQRRKLLEFDGIHSVNLPKRFTGELRPYQKAAYDWLHFLNAYRFGGCLADDMGLGKTIEALVFIQSLKESGQTKGASLFVLPRSLLVNWQRETSRFTPDLNFYIHFGNDRVIETSNLDKYDLVFTTYGTMLRDIEFLRTYRFHYVILDESQAIKNPLAKTSKAVRLLKSHNRLVLTGTPVENSTFELWSQFAFLNPGLLGNLEYFKREFVNPIEKKGDHQSAELLRKMVYPFILRRTKDQVAPELPPRTERVIFSDMEPAQHNIYNKTRDYYRGLLMGIIDEKGMDNARMKVLEGLLRLRQICNHPRLFKPDFRGESSKFQLLLETLETLQAEGHKGLVFSQFVKMLKLIRGELDVRKIPYEFLDGKTRNRQERVDSFQMNLSIPFFLISLKAGGVGLNLTAADYVIHVDPWWNPAVEMQATDRTHRIGQDKPVFVYKFITRDSVEEKILLLQEKKKALVDQLITTESAFFKTLSPADVEILFS